MKKILVIAFCAFLLCGCGKKEDGWEKKIQLSTLEIEDSYITGQIKNLEDKAYKLTLTVELKSGSLTVDNTCYETIKPNETRDLKCLILSDSVTDSYTAEVKTVTLNEMDIPELKEGEITRETLEYHFEDIYDAHTLNFVSLMSSFDDIQYPYIDKIEYKEDKVTFTCNFTKDKNFVSYVESFDAKTSKLAYAFFYASVNNDSEYTNSLLTKISLMPSISTSSSDSLAINRALKRTDIKDGYCINAGNWCISTKTDGSLNSYLILPKH